MTENLKDKSQDSCRELWKGHISVRKKLLYIGSTDQQHKGNEWKGGTETKNFTTTHHSIVYYS